MLGNEISQIAGVNEELLGSAEDDKAGILSLLRQGAGLVTLQPIFDNLDQSQVLLNKIHLQMIQANWTPGKVSRIIDDEPAEEFYNRAFSKYDAIVEEAPLTSTQKQLALQQSLYLREMGIPIPTEYIIENMQLPNKDKLMEQIKATEQAQQQQEQMMAQAQMEAARVDNETKLGFAAAQQAQAQERMGKIRLDAASAIEKLEKSQDEKIESALNLIKAAKEIKGMDISHIAQVLQMVNETEQIQQAQEQSKHEMQMAQQDRQMQQQAQAQPQAQEQPQQGPMMAA